MARTVIRRRCDRDNAALATRGARRARPRGRSALIEALIGSCLLAIATATWAQRAEENVVTAAEDAFGTSVGYQSIGLYNPNDARGFSPRQAGNLRMEGLYFDQEQNGGDYDSCLVHESAMRIGIAAQTFSFPAPTGIADMKLTIPGDTAVLSAIGNLGSYDELDAFLEARAPVNASLSVEVCAAYNRNFVPELTESAHKVDLGNSWRWRPGEGTEIVPFWSYSAGGARGLRPFVYTDATAPPPLFDQRALATQSFTTWDWHAYTLGLIATHSFTAQWSLAAGLFRYHEHDPLTFVDEYLSLLPNRTVDHELDITPPITSAATSGELRLSRRSASGAEQRSFQVTLRGRNVDRNFGGDTLVDYGVVGLDSAPPPPLAPPFVTTAVTDDHVRQFDVGAEFDERIQNIGSFGIGLLKTFYRRTVSPPGGAAVTLNTKPWLLNLRLTAEPGPAATLYASYTQGLEDSAIAPSTAVNRGEAPPATRTYQIDGGVRWRPNAALTAIFGAFTIHKVYFNLDAANVYQALGTIRHTGLESSLTYGADGLTVVAGAVWIRPHVDRVIPEPGATGVVPIGPVPLTLKFNVDYAPPRWGPWSVNAQWNWLSSRVSTADDLYSLPPLSTIGAGVRYSSTVRGRAWSLRLDGMNLTNATGLTLSPFYQVLSELGRRFLLTAAIDL